MKKILLGLSILMITLMVVPNVAAQSTSDNTEINVSLNTSGDVNASLIINADGSVSLTVDGVPVKEEFSSINSAINYLSYSMDSKDKELSSDIEYNTDQINKNSEMISYNSSIISIHENKLEIVLANTIYNKKSHDNLENRHNALVNSHIALQAGHNALQTDYNELFDDYQDFLQDNYGKLKENYQVFYQEMVFKVKDLEKRSDTLENHRNYTTAGGLLLVAALGLGFRKSIGGSVNRGTRRVSGGARRAATRLRRGFKTPRKN